MLVAVVNRRVNLRRTGRTPHELEEIPPTCCPNSDPLGERQVIVGYWTHPDEGRRRLAVL